MKRATIRDVALEAGVSMMTVSRVINNGTNVQPETRARVQAAIDALNFMPSQSARSLRARHRASPTHRRRAASAHRAS